MNPTNDPALRSWVPVPPESPFPIQNLPYGVFRRRNDRFRTESIGVAIGDQVLDLRVLAEERVLERHIPSLASLFLAPTLNAFLAAGPDSWAQVRVLISGLLRDDNPELRSNPFLRDLALVSQA